MLQPANKNYNFDNEWDSFAKKGDLHSLKIIYNHYFDLLHHYGKRFQTENHLIEDAIQNLFANLIKVHLKLCSVNNLHAYLLCSFRNELLHLMHKSKRINLYDNIPEFKFHPAIDPEEQVIHNEILSELKSILKTCISKLTSSQQEILYMRYDQGLSYEDISDILKISVESCRTSVYRAIKSMKRDMGDGEKNISTLF
jgi:RNA polymerase sigma factor (sigma-70 family)